MGCRHEKVLLILTICYSELQRGDRLASRGSQRRYEQQTVATSGVVIANTTGILQAACSAVLCASITTTSLHPDSPSSRPDVLSCIGLAILSSSSSLETRRARRRTGLIIISWTVGGFPSSVYIGIIPGNRRSSVPCNATYLPSATNSVLFLHLAPRRLSTSPREEGASPLDLAVPFALRDHYKRTVLSRARKALGASWEQ
jgi:hypothetical protein